MVTWFLRLASVRVAPSRVVTEKLGEGSPRSALTRYSLAPAFDPEPGYTLSYSGPGGRSRSRAFD